MVYLVLLIARLVSALPLGTALALGRGLGAGYWLVFRPRREPTIETLCRCLPGTSRAEALRILGRMYRHQGMNIIESLRVSVRGLEDFDGRVTVHGREHLDRLNASESGVLLLMGHLGNWEMCGYATRYFGRPANVVVKPIKNDGVQRFIESTRERMNLRMILRQGSFPLCLRALQRKEIVAIILDQNQSRHQGLFVDFFGKPACTSPGLALLAARGKSPVFPLYSFRRGNRHHDLYFSEPLPSPDQTDPESLRAATQIYTRFLEDRIREHPDQWIWMHRRWRTKPEG